MSLSVFSTLHCQYNIWKTLNMKKVMYDYPVKIIKISIVTLSLHAWDGFNKIIFQKSLMVPEISDYCSKTELINYWTEI
jgi:hypothetical protein